MFSLIIVYLEDNETRRNALDKTLECIKKQTYKDFELVFVEMLFDNPSNVVISNGKHIQLKYPPHLQDRMMNKSWCINVGVRNSQYDNLVVMDADMCFDEGYFQRIVDYSQKGDKFFICFDKIFCEIGRDNPEERIRPAFLLKTAGGVFFIKKDFFWDVGGMNESYFGYGSEDNDFWRRANHLLGTINNMPDSIQHTYHHWYTGRYKLNPNREKFFYTTMVDISKTIKTLKELNLGGDEPQPIYQ